MTEQQFCYWLQGYTELNGAVPTPEQWKSIKEHLQTVFKKVTPQVTFPTSPSIPSIPNFPFGPTPFLNPNQKLEVIC